LPKLNSNAVKTAIGLVIAAVAIWFTFRNTDLQELQTVLIGTRWVYTVAVLPALTLSYVFRIYRWTTLLAPIKKVSKADAAGPLITGFMLNSILPGRIGEFARAALLSRKADIPFASSFATVVVARLFDGLALTGLALVVMGAMWNSLSSSIRGGLIAAGCGYIGVLFVLIALRRWHEATARFLVFPLRKLRFSDLAVKIEKALLEFAAGLDILKDPVELLKVSFFTIGVWVSLCLSVVPLFYALGMQWVWHYPPLILVLAGFGMLIPTPAGTGTVHYAIGVLFPVITGIPEPQAKALAILFHATQFVPVIIAGLAVSKGNAELLKK
jgi:uncharacterized protein (TIRG00374 family)